MTRDHEPVPAACASVRRCNGYVPGPDTKAPSHWSQQPDSELASEQWFPCPGSDLCALTVTLTAARPGPELPGNWINCGGRENQAHPQSRRQSRVGQNAEWTATWLEIEPRSWGISGVLIQEFSSRRLSICSGDRGSWQWSMLWISARRR